jgi:hypothetical protein
MSVIVPITGPLIEAFAGTFLSPRYDNPEPTPQFHREAWNLYAQDLQAACVVAPRGHAKSTALTFDYILCEVLFRRSDYVLLIGSTEDKAAEQLSNINEELHENKDLREEFGIVGFETEQKTEVIAICEDGHRFRILARGAEQKIRGAMWKGKRPNLIVCDDMEDDEQVESSNRREKFRNWFFRAAKQSLSTSGRIRVHGTILHEDSLLMRLSKNKAWKTLFYKAHKGYDDFSELLWPEKWTEALLREIRSEFEGNGDSTGYAQEYLNDPYDRSDSYLKKEHFKGMNEDDKERDKLYYAGCDFAVSKLDHANRTSFTVGGLDLDGMTHIVDERVDRWDSGEWIAEMLYIQKTWNIDMWFVEGGVIWKSVSPILFREMNGRTRSDDLKELLGTNDIYMNIEVLNPVKDKGIRGRAFQRRMKAGMVKFDKQASWYGPYEEELLRFTGVAQARLDDQFDSTATLFLGIDMLGSLEEEDLEEPDEIEEEEQVYYKQVGQRNTITGY